MNNEKDNYRKRKKHFSLWLWLDSLSGWGQLIVAIITLLLTIPIGTTILTIATPILNFCNPCDEQVVTVIVPEIVPQLQTVVVPEIVRQVETVVVPVIHTVIVTSTSIPPTNTPEAVFTAIQTVSLTSATNINIRSFPSVTAPVVGNLPPNETAIVSGQKICSNTRWWQVSFDGKTGWVHGDVVDVGGDTESVPPAEAICEYSITIISVEPHTPDLNCAATVRFVVNVQRELRVQFHVKNASHGALGYVMDVYTLYPQTTEYGVRLGGAAAQYREHEVWITDADTGQVISNRVAAQCS